MKQESKLRIGTAGLVALVATAGIAATSFAYQGDPNVKGPDYTPERHTAMTQAFEGNDYNAWKEARGETKARGRIMEVINEENFNRFVEIRNLRLAGDTEGAEAIRKELGLGQGKMSRGEGGKRGNGEGRGAHRSGERGQDAGGKFIDENNDGICDRMQ